MSKAPITSPLAESERNTVGNLLQATLVDMIDLSLTAKQAHWNVVGKQFPSVHAKLDTLTATARTYTDQIAERANAIGVSPNGKARTVAESTGIPEFPDNWQPDTDVIATVESILASLIQRLRARIEDSDKNDLVTQDLLIEITKELEKEHWMWQAQQA